MYLKKEKSCGCVIIKNNKVLLVFQKNNQFWGFPKGHVEVGENEIETALREVKEEVGLDVDIYTHKRYEINYITSDEIDKTTVLYLATPKSEKIIMQESEIQNIKWCHFDEALNLLSYDNLKEVFTTIIQDLQN